MKLASINKGYNIVSKQLTIIGLLGYLFIGLLPPQAAAEGVSTTIEPTTLQIRATAPADIKTPITIKNTGNDPLTLQIRLVRFRDSGEGTGTIVYDTSLLSDEPYDQFLTNIQVLIENQPVTSLTLEPQQTRELTLAIPILQEEKTQDQYFSLLFLSNTDNQQQDDSTDEITATTTFSTGIAVPVTLSINQNNQKMGFLREFSMPVVQQKGPIPFTIDVSNTGNHFISASGVLLITNMFGQTVKRIDIPETTILAGSNRILGEKDNNGYPKVIWDEPFLFGFYTATLAVGIEPEQSLYTQKSSFLVLPIWSIIGLILGIIFLTFFIVKVKHKLSQQ